MRITSTPQSIAAGQITVLAVVETLVSIAIYGAIAFWTNAITHIAVAVCCAPLLLLRTRYSYRLGIALFDWYLGRDIKSRPAPIFLLALIISPLAGPIIRFYATLVSVLRHPIRTVREIPKNWYRQCLCTDLAHLPEVVPGEEQLTSVQFGFRFLLIINPKETKDFSNLEKFILTILRLILILFGYIPSIILRISFKATSIAYIPLIFVAQTTAASRSSLSFKLAQICRGELEKARRWVSLSILSLAALKLLAVSALVDADTLNEYTISAPLAQLLLVGGIWPWWQLLLVVDAAITFALWFYSDRMVLAMEFKEAGSKMRIRTILDSLTFLRGVLACTAVITAGSWAVLLLVHRYL